MTNSAIACWRAVLVDAMLATEIELVDQEQLIALARLRSENAKARLVKQFNIEPSRLYLSDAKVDGAVSGLTLTLEK
jgi:hypothetical protein